MVNKHFFGVTMSTAVQDSNLFSWKFPLNPNMKVCEYQIYIRGKELKELVHWRFF